MLLSVLSAIRLSFPWLLAKNTNLFSPGNVVSGCEGRTAPHLPRALSLTDSRLPLLAPDAVDGVELKPAALDHQMSSLSS